MLGCRLNSSGSEQWPVVNKPWEFHEKDSISCLVASIIFSKIAFCTTYKTVTSSQGHPTCFSLFTFQCAYQ